MEVYVISRVWVEEEDAVVGVGDGDSGRVEMEVMVAEWKW